MRVFTANFLDTNGSYADGKYLGIDISQLPGGYYSSSASSNNRQILEKHCYGCNSVLLFDAKLVGTPFQGFGCSSGLIADSYTVTLPIGLYRNLSSKMTRLKFDPEKAAFTEDGTVRIAYDGSPVKVVLLCPLGVFHFDPVENAEVYQFLIDAGIDSRDIPLKYQFTDQPINA